MPEPLESSFLPKDSPKPYHPTTPQAARCMKNILKRVEDVEQVAQHALHDDAHVILLANTEGLYAVCTAHPLSGTVSIDADGPRRVTMAAPLTVHGLSDLLHDQWSDRVHALNRFRAITQREVPIPESGRAPFPFLVSA